MSSPLIVERRGTVLEVTIDRPKANAIDAATSRIMGDIFRELPRRSRNCASPSSPAPARNSSARAGISRPQPKAKRRCRLWRRRFRRAAGTAGPQQAGDRRGERPRLWRRLRDHDLRRHHHRRRTRDLCACRKSIPARLPMPRPSNCRAAFPIMWPWRCSLPDAASMPHEAKHWGIVNEIVPAAI